MPKHVGEKDQTHNSSGDSNNFTSFFQGYDIRDYSVGEKQDYK